MAINPNRELHAAGETTLVTDWRVMQALGWWVAAELVRRHPGQLYLLQTGGEFQYDCLAVTRLDNSGRGDRSATIVWMNRQPGGHFTTGTWFDDSNSTERFNWLEVLLTPDRLGQVVRQLETEAGLASPDRPPATTRDTIGARVIAGFLARTLFQRKSWVAAGGMWDSGMGETGPNRELFEQVPGMRGEVPRPDASKHFPRTSFRHWFLCPTVQDGPPGECPEFGPPVVGFDLATGRCWNGGDAVDLLARYDQLDRSVDALISDVCPPAY